MAANSAQTDYDKLKEDLAAVRSDLSKISETLGEDVRHRRDNGMEAVKRNARAAQEQARRAAEGVSQGVSERPLTSVFVAFGVGMLVGKLFTRQ